MSASSGDRAPQFTISSPSCSPTASNAISSASCLIRNRVLTSFSMLTEAKDSLKRLLIFRSCSYWSICKRVMYNRSKVACLLQSVLRKGQNNLEQFRVEWREPNMLSWNGLAAHNQLSLFPLSQPGQYTLFTEVVPKRSPRRRTVAHAGQVATADQAYIERSIELIDTSSPGRAKLLQSTFRNERDRTGSRRRQGQAQV